MLSGSKKLEKDKNKSLLLSSIDFTESTRRFKSPLFEI